MKTKRKNFGRCMETQANFFYDAVLDAIWNFLQTYNGWHIDNDISLLSLANVNEQSEDIFKTCSKSAGVASRRSCRKSVLS